MYGVLHRRWEQSGPNQQERLMLSFEKMFAREKENALWELYHLWQNEASRKGTIPLVEDFQYKTKLPKSVTRYICWSDVTAENPFNFITRDHAHLTAFANHSDRRLGDHPIPMNARACAAEYLHCIQTRQPIYYEIDQTFGTISRHLMRMMVPVADDDGSIARLVYAVRIISSSDRGAGDDNSRTI